MKKKSHLKPVFLLLTLISLSALLLSCASLRNTDHVPRISPEEARAAVTSNRALLVCSYDDNACKDVLLEGAMLRSEFESALASFSKDQPIIFYCG